MTTGRESTSVTTFLVFALRFLIFDLLLAEEQIKRQKSEIKNEK
jgi:preprotein translocase subunit YajC